MIREIKLKINTENCNSIEIKKRLESCRKNSKEKLNFKKKSHTRKIELKKMNLRKTKTGN